MVTVGHSESGDISLVLSIRLNVGAFYSLPNNIREKVDGRNRIETAVKPFFLDITDPGRHFLYSESPEQFIDSSESDKELITLNFPQNLQWHTEGDTIRVDLGQRVSVPISVQKYWFKHIDGMFTLNFAFNFSYAHNVRNYYVLSSFLKALYPKQENLDSINSYPDGIYIEGTQESIWDYIRSSFKKEAQDLFGAAHPEPHKSWDEFINITEKGVQQPLCLVRSSIVIRDPYFFTLLNQSPKGRKLKTFEFLDDKLEYGPEDLDRLDENPDLIATFFISGFVHNVIDFMRQDGAEAKDGSDFDYPFIESNSIEEQESELEGSEYLLYVSDVSVFEIVSQSRSMESAFDYIGTCPYLFFVHMMTLHDESLIIIHESVVKDLLRHLERNGWTEKRWKELSSDLDKMNLIIDNFDRASIVLFDRVDKFKHMDMLSYQTEKDFRSIISQVRGFDERSTYWGNLIQKLESKVGEIRNKVTAEHSERFGVLLFVVAFLGFVDALNVGAEAWKSIFIEDERTTLHLEKYLQLDAMAVLFIILVFIVVVLFQNWKLLKKNIKNIVWGLSLFLCAINVLLFLFK